MYGAIKWMEGMEMGLRPKWFNALYKYRVSTKCSNLPKKYK